MVFSISLKALLKKLNKTELETLDAFAENKGITQKEAVEIILSDKLEKIKKQDKVEVKIH